ARSDGRLAGTRSRILDALSLSEGVVGQYHVALARQVREQFLVTRPRLAIHRMAERSQNRRMAASRGRQVEVSGDVQARPAFKRHLLDSIAWTLDDAGHARIERILLE